MNSGSFRYLVKQGIMNTWLNRMMSVASIGILTACLIIIGGAALISFNLRGVFISIEQQSEMAVFILDDSTQEQIKQLGDKINGVEHVIESKFVSKKQALEEEKKRLGDDGGLFEGLENDNPYPASYRVKLDDLSHLEAVQKQVEGFAGVDSVSSLTQLADTMSALEKTLIILGAIIIGILIISSIVVISNTIKLTVFARRREINIMKYVGATNAFIRMPFVVEGITIGVVSALLAFFILFAIYGSLSQMVTLSSIKWLSSMSGNLIPFSRMWYWLVGGFLLSGLTI
ncbi:MAG: permease-like cell division protein FtsX, partial [Oscillospiraceae bacterium]